MPVFNNRACILSVLVIVFGVTLVQFASVVDSTPVESVAKGSLREEEEEEEENEIQTDGFRVAHVREKKSIHNRIEPLKSFSSSKADNRADEKRFPNDDNISRNIENINNISNSIKTERKNKRRPAERINSDSKQYLHNGEYIDKIIFSEHGNQLPVSRRSPRQSSPLVFVNSNDGSHWFAPDSTTQDDQFGVNEYERGSMVKMNEMPAVMSPRYDEMADYVYYPANRFSVHDADTMMMTETEGYEPISRAMNYDPILMDKNDNFASAYVMAPDNRQYESTIFRTADGGYGANDVHGYIINDARSEDNYRAADGGLNHELIRMDDYSPESRTLNVGHQTSSFPEIDVHSELGIEKEPPQLPAGHQASPIVVVQPLVIPITKPGCLFPSKNPYLHQHKPLTKPDISLPSLHHFLKPELLDILKPELPHIPKPVLPHIHKPEGLPGIPKPPEIPKPHTLPNLPLPNLPTPPSTPPLLPPSFPSSESPVTKPVIYLNKQYVIDQKPIQVPVNDKVDDVQQHPPMIHRTFVLQPNGRIQGYTSASPAPYRDPLPFDGRQQLGNDYYVKVPYLINVPPIQRAQNEIMVKPQSTEEILLGTGTPKGILQSGNLDLSTNNTLSQTEVLRGALEGGYGFDYGAMVSNLGTPPQKAPADPLRVYMLSRMKKIDQEVGDLSRKLDTLQLQQRLAHVLAGDRTFLRRPTQWKRENQKEDLILERGEDDELCCEEIEHEKQQEEALVKETIKTTEGTEERGKETKKIRKDDNRQAVTVSSMKDENKKTTKENTKVNDQTETQPNTSNKSPMAV